MQRRSPSCHWRSENAIFVVHRRCLDRPDGHGLYLEHRLSIAGQPYGRNGSSHHGSTESGCESAADHRADDNFDTAPDCFASTTRNRCALGADVAIVLFVADERRSRFDVNLTDGDQQIAAYLVAPPSAAPGSAARIVWFHSARDRRPDLESHGSFSRRQRRSQIRVWSQSSLTVSSRGMTPRYMPTTTSPRCRPTLAWSSRPLTSSSLSRLLTPVTHRAGGPLLWRDVLVGRLWRRSVDQRPGDDGADRPVGGLVPALLAAQRRSRCVQGDHEAAGPDHGAQELTRSARVCSNSRPRTSSCLAATADEISNAAGSDSDTRTTRTDHQLEVPDASRADRDTWLTQILHFAPAGRQHRAEVSPPRPRSSPGSAMAGAPLRLGVGHDPAVDGCDVVAAQHHQVTRCGRPSCP